MNAQKRIITAIHIKRLYESFHEIMNNSAHATLFKLFSIGLFREGFSQVRKNTPVQMLDFSEIKYRRPTRSVNRRSPLCCLSKRNALKVKINVAFNFNGASQSVFLSFTLLGVSLLVVSSPRLCPVGLQPVTESFLMFI